MKIIRKIIKNKKIKVSKIWEKKILSEYWYL